MLKSGIQSINRELECQEQKFFELQKGKFQRN